MKCSIEQKIRNNWAQQAEMSDILIQIAGKHLNQLLQQIDVLLHQLAIKSDQIFKVHVHVLKIMSFVYHVYHTKVYASHEMITLTRCMHTSIEQT